MGRFDKLDLGTVIGLINAFIQSSLPATAFKGFWNANTNAPDYATTLTTAGDYFIAMIAGSQTINTVDLTFAVGDFLVRTATGYERIAANQPPVSLAALSTGDIPQYDGTNLVPSSLAEETETVESAKTLQSMTGFLTLSEALSIVAAGEAFALRDIPNDLWGYLIGYNRLDDGTGRPYWRSLGAKQSGVVIQPLKDTNTGSANAIIPVAFTANRLITAVTVESTQTVTGVSVFLKRGTTTLASMTGLSFTADTETTVQIPQGVICSDGSTLNVDIQGVILKGTGTVGVDFELFLKLDNWIWEAVNIPDDNNVVSIIEGKTGDDRLDATSLKNLPSATAFDPAAHSVTEFNDVTSAGSGGIITTTERGNIRTIEQLFNAIKVFFTDGMNTTVSIDDVNNRIAINATGGGTTPPTSPHDLYMDVTADNLAASVDTGTAVSSNLLNPTLTIPTYTGNRYLQILQAETHTQFTSLEIGGLNQIAAFTINSAARTISGQSYRQYVSTNLLTDAFSGQQVVMGGAV